MKKTIKLSLVTLSLLMIGGCQPSPITMEEQGTSVQTTTYTESLRNANTMIEMFHGKKVFIYVDSVKNLTSEKGKVPPELSVVVKSSLNGIGSNVAVIADPSREIAIGKSRFYKINGGVTQFDVTDNSGSGIKASGQGTYNGQQGVVDGGVKSGDKTTKLTLTFNPQDGMTGMLVPLTSTANQIIVKKKSSSNEFAFSILGSGIGINNAISKSHGIHSSLKILVELSIVETLGKLTKYPYWLLTGGKANSEIINHLSREFLRDKLDEKIQKISYLFQLRGENIQATKVLSDDLKKLIIKYKSSHGMPSNDNIDRTFYISLLRGA
jgi:hypothetical protein